MKYLIGAIILMVFASLLGVTNLLQARGLNESVKGTQGQIASLISSTDAYRKQSIADLSALRKDTETAFTTVDQKIKLLGDQVSSMSDSSSKDTSTLSTTFNAVQRQLKALSTKVYQDHCKLFDHCKKVKTKKGK